MASPFTGSSGHLIRQLPVKGVTSLGCTPVRYWNASTILASCWQKLDGQPVASRLWLVAASGKAPRALTPIRSSSSRDQGVDAAAAPC